MAAKNKKGKAAKQPHRKPSARSRAQTGSRIDQLVAVQQRALKRYADLSTDAMNRIVTGDFNVARWVEYSAQAWSDAIEDLGIATQTTLQIPWTQPPRSKGRSKPDGLSDSARSWLALQESFLRRTAQYSRKIAQLIAAGSIEPREWIDGGVNFWSDVIADTADWTRGQTGVELRPTAEWIPRLQGEVREEKLRQGQHLDIDVPAGAFTSDTNSSFATITLFTDGLARVGGGITLTPGQNIDFNPNTVQRSSPHSVLQLHDLPGSLVQGDVYAGLVWAKETRVVIVAVEVKIV